MELLNRYQIKNLELKNRIVLPPMDMYSSDDQGYVHNTHLYHYVSRAIGGVGLIIVEATAITPAGRITDNCLGIWSDEHVNGLKEIVDECHQYGAKVGIQINHAGRKCTATSLGTDKIYAPSHLAFNSSYRLPEELAKTEIQSIIKEFGAAAKRADQAGYDLLEIHGAHGYLISEFLSPLTNKRSDEYGGSLENRTRFLKEVLAEVKMNWTEEKPISLRVSANDYLPEGMQPEDMVKIINQVKGDIDIVHVSSGGVAEAPIKAFPGYQVPLSEVIKKGCDMPTITVGLITESIQVEEILKNKRADLVAIGRGLFRNPYWVNQVAYDNRIDDHEYPEFYQEAYKLRR